MSNVSAKVSEFKNRLSEFLSLVRNGDEVVVCDRNTPIARVIPFAPRKDLQIRKAKASFSSLFIQPVRLKKAVDVLSLLQDMREDS